MKAVTGTDSSKTSPHGLIPSWNDSDRLHRLETEIMKAFVAARSKDVSESYRSRRATIQQIWDALLPCYSYNDYILCQS